MRDCIEVDSHWPYTAYQTLVNELILLPVTHDHQGLLEFS